MKKEAEGNNFLANVSEYFDRAAVLTGQPADLLNQIKTCNSMYYFRFPVRTARGYEVTAIQILDRQEIEPALTGDLKLVDAEDGSLREISVSNALLKTYKANLDRYCADLRAFCLRYGMNYQLVANDTPVEVVITRMLRGSGLVK